MARYFEDVEPGDRLGPLERVATRETVRDFLGIWNVGEVSSFFTSPEFAGRMGLPGPIVPGPLCTVYMAQLLTTWAETAWIRKLDLVFRQPVPQHVTLRVVGVVTDKHEGDGERLVECDLSLETPRGDRLVAGKAVVLLPSRGSEPRSADL